MDASCTKESDLNRSLFPSLVGPKCTDRYSHSLVGLTYQSSGSQSRKPFANGLLAIFSCVIWNETARSKYQIESCAVFRKRWKQRRKQLCGVVCLWSQIWFQVGWMEGNKKFTPHPSKKNSTCGTNGQLPKAALKSHVEKQGKESTFFYSGWCLSPIILQESTDKSEASVNLSAKTHVPRKLMWVHLSWVKIDVSTSISGTHIECWQKVAAADTRPGMSKQRAVLVTQSR